LGIEGIGNERAILFIQHELRRNYFLSTWKRGFLEIIAEILDSLMSNPLKKTHITFKCNLDSRAVTKYLSIMLFVGLVERSQTDPSFFVITQKGIKYRNQFQSFVSLMENDMQKITLQNLDAKQVLANLKIGNH